MKLNSEPIRCLRGLDGTLIRPSAPTDRDLYRICDVCGDKYTTELLEAGIRSTWEALRLGYHPTERRTGGAVARLSISPSDHGWLFTEEYPPKLQPHYFGFIGMQHVGERWSR